MAVDVGCQVEVEVGNQMVVEKVEHEEPQNSSQYSVSTCPDKQKMSGWLDVVVW